ncbi:ABC transporter substrate-binding protein [Prauserella marina]|nr:ABC transporter substrate-binding protein [Prauserella marina]
MDRSAQRTVPLLAADGTLTRRGVLQLGGLGLGAFTFGGLLSACTSETPEGAAGAIDSERISAMMSDQFDNLDPTSTVFATTIAINDLIYESLYRTGQYRPVGDPTPELAASLPEEVDPTTYRIALREDVTFHDGSPLTADDVVFTIERIKDPNTPGFRSQFLSFIQEARSTGTYEVTLRLQHPTTLLVQRLSLVKVMSRKAVNASSDAVKMSPVGTGPYQVVSGVSGQQLNLRKYGKYSGQRHIEFQNVEIKVATDSAARVAGLKTGNAQVIQDVPGASVDSLSEESAVGVEAVKGDFRIFFCFNCKKAPFDNKLARQAILYGIDRDAIVKSTFFGLAEPAWAGQIQPDDPDYTRPSTVYRYDPQHAKSLLRQAGVADGEPMSIGIVSTDYVASQGPIIEENLRSLGLNPSIVPGAPGAIPSRMSKGEFHAVVLAGASDIFNPTAEFYLRYVYYGAFPRTVSHWDTEQLRQIEADLDEAVAAGNEEERKNALSKVQEGVQDEVPFATLVWKRQITGWSSSLENFRPLGHIGFPLDDVRVKS